MKFALIPVPGTVGPTELIILLTIILLVFGAKRIPKLARGLSTGVRELRRGTSGETEKDEVMDYEADKELPLSEATQNGKTRAEDENARARQKR